MTFATLALIGAAGLLGPLLAAPAAWRIPVVTGELIAGLVLGGTGFGWLDAGDATFTLLADIGFALVMFVAGTHVPVRDPVLRGSLLPGAARAAVVGVVAAGLAVGLAAVFDTGHAALYAVLMASSSAALILPIVDAQQLSGPTISRLIPQVAIADAACIVALPLVLDRNRVGPAVLGAVAVAAGAVLLFLGLRALERSGIRRRAHRLSERRGFALELRISLVMLFALAAAQLGVPVAAATLATQQNLLTPGEAPALLLGALVTIAAASVASGRAARRTTAG